MEDVAAAIRHARAEAQLSQVDLAGLAGTSQPALARYETGVTIPTLPTLERLLAACGRQLQISAPPATERSLPATSMRGRLGPQARRLRQRRRKLVDAAKEHGVTRLRVFGSLARGEGIAGDVDLLVDLQSGRTLIDLAAFRREATKILDMPVDVATVDMLKQRIRDEVLTEALPL
jgi:uncharacterized protein